MKLYRQKTVAVVVPAFNERELIAEALTSIPEYVDWIVFVDDGSTDGTSESASVVKDERIVRIVHSANHGVGAAIATGYRWSIQNDVDVTVVMAGDNQMDSTYLPALLDPIVDGTAEYSKGSRFLDKRHLHGMSKWRYLGNSVLTISTKFASGYWSISDSQHGYAAISRKTLDSILGDGIYPGYGYCNDILVKLNTHHARVVEVAMPSRYGREVSKIRYGRYILRVSLLLARGLLWRIKKERKRRRFVR